MTTDGQPADGGGQLAPLSDARLAEIWQEWQRTGNPALRELLAERERLLVVVRTVAEAPTLVVYRGIDDTTHTQAYIVTRGKLSIIEQARAALAADAGERANEGR